MGKVIEGIIERPLKIISDERGSVMHMLRCDDEGFDGFGEVYFSSVNAGVVKGWKKHTRATQNFAVPIGKIKLVIYDDRKDSSTFDTIQEVVLGVNDYKLVCVPANVWYSFGAIGEMALLANCTDLAYDPQESISMPLDAEDIPYKWSNK